MNNPGSRPISSLIRSSSALILIGLLVQPPPAEATQRIRLGTLVPKGSSYYNEINKMGHEWAKATRGKISLTIYPDGRMGSEAQMVRRMRVGQLQAGFLSAVGLTEIEPAVSGLQNLPLMFDSLEEVDHIGTQLQPLLEKQLEKKGFKALFWFNAGWVYFFTKSPISTPDDLRKLKIFSWAGSPEVVDIYKSAGFNPVPLETKDILTGLQTRLITAVPMPPPYANAFQVDKKAPHMLDLNWAPLVGAAVVITKAWNRLDPETKTEALKIAKETESRIQKIGREEETKSIAAMKNRGLKVHEISEETRAQWKQAVKEIYPQIRGKIVPADIFDRVSVWLEEYRQQ
ncbi:MAG: 2,3-diketo-L-gulonate-binding periplasmic protein YiaO [Verrucomicrobia subdivision 3 bacterium]|nr:2,3-diketo-L-gulonate-binding periplasmic protein YiaO [Limisphaerales bacterium]MCS1413089.1 2,3-diketo-L-gulonate-binding periplasmic protein YiaO [Limisphaerales bacterium]